MNEPKDILSQIRAQRKVAIISNGIKFSLGSIVVTPPALALLQKTGYSAAALIARHVHGDWGDCHGEDGTLNDCALLDGSRVFSVYRLVEAGFLKEIPRSKRTNLPTIWIITNATNEAGVRDVTTLLTPRCY
jgi:hypothetical protein